MIGLGSDNQNVKISKGQQNLGKCVIIMEIRIMILLFVIFMILLLYIITIQNHNRDQPGQMCNYDGDHPQRVVAWNNSPGEDYNRPQKNAFCLLICNNDFSEQCIEDKPKTSALLFHHSPSSSFLSRLRT